MSKLEELQKQIEGEWPKLEEMGYGKVDLKLLLMARYYFLVGLSNQEIVKIEQIKKRTLTNSEMDMIKEDIGSKYPKYAGNTLVETLRHQVDHKRDSEITTPVPIVDSPDYKVLTNVLGSIGSALQQIDDLIPEGGRYTDYWPAVAIRKYG